MKLTIGKYDVTIKDSLTWGDAQAIQGVMASGAKISTAGMTGFDASAMIEAKYRLLELAVTGIVDNSEEVPPGEPHRQIAFTRDWMNNLSIDDGDKLFAAVDAISKKK